MRICASCAAATCCPGRSTYSAIQCCCFARIASRAVPIHGWVAEYLDGKAWDEIGRDLRATLPPYIVVDQNSALLIRGRNPAIAELLESRYEVAFIGASGTWYVRR